jgi:hypothetical protein
MKSNKFISLLFVIVSLLLFNNCDKDEDAILITEKLTQRTLTKRIVSKEEINNNFRVTEFLNRYLDFNDSNTQKRFVHDSINNLFIDTDEAIYIEEADNHSYTFFVRV